MKNIKDIFIKSGIVTSEKDLDIYLDFIETHRVKTKIKNKTSHHHILPKAKNLPFVKYSNLKLNIWNGAFLYFKDHYTAHYLLCKATEHKSVLFAFCAMNNLDLYAGKIKKNELIGPYEYNELFQKSCKAKSLLYSDPIWKETIGKEASKKHRNTINNPIWKETIGKNAGLKCSRLMLSKEWKETIGKEKIRKIKETINSPEWKETVGKEKELKRQKTINNQIWKETVGKEKGLKRQRTINSPEWKETVGKKQAEDISKLMLSKEWKETVGKEAVKKHKETKNSLEWKETVGKEAKRKSSETQLKKGKWFRVLYKNKVIYNLVPLKCVCALSQSLLKTSKEKPLGHSKNSKINLNRLKKLDLIGYYIEIVKPTEYEMENYFRKENNENKKHQKS